ncbi:hypothetical protein VN97_g4111 [Penicillium thymicola]|uniref:Uncharacterized protein n=1 Tax=Penicillium thymicola TaxID=293382 RepID=A0AAI9TL56_PENTH|nr:hypothetical protein VN97_g4111 [Penicillium thymicola]
MKQILSANIIFQGCRNLGILLMGYMFANMPGAMIVIYKIESKGKCSGSNYSVQLNVDQRVHDRYLKFGLLPALYQIKAPIFPSISSFFQDFHLIFHRIYIYTRHRCRLHYVRH